MKALVYRQAFDYNLPHNVPLPLHVTGRDVLYGYMRMVCSDCRGAKGFDIHGDWHPCVVCKATGKEWVSL